MNLFHELEQQAITRTGGTYKQVKLYVRGEDVYVKHGAGFARVYKNGTSVPKLHVVESELRLRYDDMGRATR